MTDLYRIVGNVAEIVAEFGGLIFFAAGMAVIFYEPSPIYGYWLGTVVGALIVAGCFIEHSRRKK